MENGFLVEITNNTVEQQEIKIFSGNITNGITVQTMDNRYQFDSLQMAAQVKPFRGNSLTTNSEVVVELEIINNGKPQKISLKGKHEGSPITIDGKSNYIKLTCTPNSKFYIRLTTI